MSSASFIGSIGARGKHRVNGIRKVACIGMSADAANALRSMLNVLDGRTRHHWRLTEPECADVYFVGPGAHAPDFHHDGIERPQVMVHEGEGSRSIARFTIGHPFRVMPLLSLLEDLDDFFVAGHGQPAWQADHGGSGKITGTFIDSLRNLREHGSASDWWVAPLGHDLLWVSGDGSSYRASASAIARLRAGGAEIDPLKPADQVPDTKLVQRPALELAWIVAHDQNDASVDAILGARHTFKLRHWPDFGSLGFSTWQLRAAAMLARTAVDLGRLQQFTGEPLLPIKRFLCACEISGLMEHEQPWAQAQALSVTPPNPARSGLMSRLIAAVRGKLGLEART